MSEWVTKPLSQLASFQKGRKVETSEHPREGFVPYLGASAISGTIEEYADARFGVAAAAGDVLMLWDGERSGLVGKAQNGVISSTVARLSGKGEIEDNFLYYALDEKFDWIQNRRTGTGVPHVPKDLGRILSISFPKDKNEQRRIAEVLSTLDRTIEQTEALIAKCQQMKAGLMHDLFTRGVTPDGHLRLVSEGQRTKFGWIPKDWRIGSLLDVADQIRQPILTGPFGADMGSNDFVPEGVPVLRIGNVQQGRLDLSDLLYVSEVKSRQLQRYKVNEGDLLFARQGATTGRNALASRDVQGYLINYHIIRVALDHSRCAPLFIEAAFAGEIVKRQIERDKSRGTREGINTAQLKALELPLASVDEQRAIARILMIHAALCGEIGSQLVNLRQQKHGLMHDLLTGRVRVKAGEPAST